MPQPRKLAEAGAEPLFRPPLPGDTPPIDDDREAERIRSLVLLRATCETVLARLDEDDVDDLALTVQIGELCDALAEELARFSNRKARHGS